MAHPPDLMRWREMDPASADDPRAAALFWRATAGRPVAQALPPPEAERLWQGLSRQLSPAGQWVWAGWGLLGVAALAAVGANLFASRHHAEPAPVEAPTLSPRLFTSSPPVAPVFLPAPAPIGGASPPRAIRARPELRPAPETAALDEAGLLARALEELRGQRDPRRALATLDEYASRFPEGALGREAEVTRVDAWLAIGDHAQALALLRSLDLATLPRSGDLRVMRAELLQEAGRCREALTDFEAGMEPGAPDALTERALFGRGACRQMLGDSAGSREDLEDYLQRFPEGRFASRAQEALDE